MLPTIAKLAAKHDIRPMKKYGQNFIYDESLCDKIVRVSNITQNDSVLEIGPGVAGLTRSILKINPKKLFVIETDIRCKPLLAELQSYYPILHVLFANALQIRVSDATAKNNNLSDKISIISNLPYNIGCKLLTNWLDEIEYIKDMTLMFQKEVAERIVASSGSKSYGRLSILCQVMCDVTKSFDVSPDAFYPKPKIWSSIVHLKPKADTPCRDTLRMLSHITALAFSARRKMLKSSLKGIDNIENILKSLNIDSMLRAENVAPDQYLSITNAVNKYKIKL